MDDTTRQIDIKEFKALNPSKDPDATAFISKENPEPETVSVDFSSNLTNAALDEQLQNFLSDVENRYFSHEEFAEGGFGKIYRAKDRILKRLVAIKSLKDECKNNDKVIKEFISEAEVTAQLDHPSIVPIYSLDTDSSNGLHLAMKLIHGETLKQVIDETIKKYQSAGVKHFEEKRALDRRIEHFLKVCDAISYAHNKQVLHRDLKPENVMIGQFNEVYVMDWGTASNLNNNNKSGGIHTRKTQEEDSEYVEGTPNYISPELLESDREIGVQSDIFSLGLILFEITTLKPAVNGENVMEVLEKIHACKFEPLTHLFSNIKIPRDLKAIILKALEKNPQDRYQSVDKMAEDLRAYLMGEEVSVRPDNFPRRTARWIHKHIALSITVVFIVVLTLVGISIYRYYKETNAVQELKRRQMLLTIQQSNVDRMGNYLDRHFLHTSNLLNGFSERLAFSLRNQIFHPGEKSYSMNDFQHPVDAPRDLIHSPLYRRMVSFDYPAYVIPQKATRRLALPQIKGIISLRKYFSELLLKSKPGSNLTPQTIDNFKQKALDSGLPVRWIYVGLKNGVFIIYPGIANMPEGYDPRKRPWYRLGLRQRGAHWGMPYIGVSGQGLVLPCSAPIFDSRDKFYGVVSLEVTYDYIINVLMKPDVLNPALVERYILDSKGRIVLSSSQANEKYADGLIVNRPLTLSWFPYKEVVKQFLYNREGQVEIEDGNKRYLIVYAPIATLNWYYLEKLDLEKLLEESPEFIARAGRHN